MVRLRHPTSAQALCDQGLFRASSARQILSGMGKVFASGLTGVIGAAEVSTLRPEDVSSAGDAAFAGTEPVSHVEVFISHTWGSPRWLKYLGICYFLNMGLAVKAAVAAWLLAVVGLMAFKATKMFCGKQYLLLLLTEFPVLIFFVFFFFGQSLSRGLWAPVHPPDESELEGPAGRSPSCLRGSVKADAGPLGRHLLRKALVQHGDGDFRAVFREPGENGVCSFVAGSMATLCSAAGLAWSRVFALHGGR